MNKYILLWVSLFFSQILSAQSLNVNGSLVIDNASSEGARIVILRNNIELERREIGKKGRFDLKFGLGADYRLFFEKDGYVTKIVNINTDVPDEIVQSNPDFPPVKLIVTLLPHVEGVDLSIFDQAIANLNYNYELDDFTFDKEYSIKIKDRIAKTEQEIRKMLAQKGSEALAREQLFAELTGKGERAFTQRHWQEAIDHWSKALQIKPDKKELEEKIAIAQKEYEREEAEKSVAAQNARTYKMLIASADSLLAGKNYTAAKEKFTMAKSLPLADEYPSKKITEIDAILAQLAKEKQAAEALQERIAKYKQIIADANQEFQQKNYDTAESLYREALTLDYEKEYPENQLKAIAAIRKEESDKQKQEEAARKQQEELRRAELMARYKQIIATADAAFKTENYAIARAHYTEADQLQTGENYPKNKIKEIDNIFNSGKYKQRLAEFNHNKKLAEQALGEKNYAGAKVYYEKAASILPIDKEEIQKKIAEVNQLIEAERLARQNKEYQIQIEKADQAYKEKSYAIAKFYYQKALEIKKDGKYAQEKLGEVEKLINERTEKTVEL
ncbi:MAG: hypothetical protein NC410_05930 [Oscillibacter sp.]|nr:hypothetical protein [Oscillibacter sp.]